MSSRWMSAWRWQFHERGQIVVVRMAKNLHIFDFDPIEEDSLSTKARQNYFPSVIFSSILSRGGKKKKCSPLIGVQSVKREKIDRENFRIPFQHAARI